MTTRPDNSIHFGCPRCTAPLVAPAAQIGRSLHCPLCHAAVCVPAQSRKPYPEAYPVVDEAGPAKPLPQPEIAFHCPACRTRMTAPDDQVGQSTACPECGTPAVVPPRPEKKPPKKMTPVEAYEVHEDADATAAQPGPKYFAVYCSLCNTLMHATEDQIGTELICPDCRTATVVHPARLPPGIPKGFGEKAGEEYAVSGASDPPRPEPRWLAFHRFGGFDSVSYGREPSEAADLPPAERPRLPRWPLASGVFGFPWRRGPRVRWLQMSIWGSLIGYLGAVAVAMANTSATGMAGVGPAILGLLATAIAATTVAGWLAVASIDGLTILTGSAAGADRIENWPNPSLFIDWLDDAFFVVNSLAMSATVGLGLTWLLNFFDLANWYAMPLTLWLLFPFVLMSMLEVNSALAPFSMAVCRSLVRHWLAWIAFYVETVLLLGSAACIAAIFLQEANIFLGIPVAIAVFSATLMIYFRLIGRLAWCCSVESPARGETKGEG